MIKKVTKRWLKGKNACEKSLDYVIKNNYIGLSPEDFIKKLMKKNRFSDANWLIVRVMNKKQKVQYAVFAAELVLPIFERKYPDDKRPRTAIEAAKNYIKKPCEETKNAAGAAAYGADADAYAAAAAYGAAAAYAAAYGAGYAGYAAKEEAQIKIIENGLKIIK